MGTEFYIKRLYNNRDKNNLRDEKTINDAINKYVKSGTDVDFDEATALINKTVTEKAALKAALEAKLEAKLKELEKEEEEKEVSNGGRSREMNMKDIKEICKANQIKLSRVVDGKRVAYKKKELMTKLKRKKLL